VNANFVNLTIERRFYESFETLADQLGLTSSILINNAMIMALKEIENLVRSKVDVPNENEIMG